MEFLLNDLSFHGQLHDPESVRAAVRRLMKIRNLAKEHGHSLFCHRNVPQALVAPGAAFGHAAQVLSLNERRALLQWITQHGPFWSDVRNHGADDWLECYGEIVTDTAIGEAAWCRANGIERELVSVAPSKWEFTPIEVDWVFEPDEVRQRIDVPNYWDDETFEGYLNAAPPTLTSWEQVKHFSVSKFSRLTFSDEAFSYLDGLPFVISAAERFVVIFDILHRLKGCFDDEGRRTQEGHRIYQSFFTGKKEHGGRGALFSDSSEREMREFKDKLTFPHPNDKNQTILCSWHGKVQTPQLRVHFSWPINAQTPLYIVYVGEKRTKK